VLALLGCRSFSLKSLSFLLKSLLLSEDPFFGCSYLFLPCF
jgi:hypothetical protein